MLANMGLNRVGTHLKGPVTVLLVLVSHSKGGQANVMVVMRKQQ